MPDSLRPLGLLPARLLCSRDFSSKNTGVVCHFLLQGFFLTQGSNLYLLHWQVDSLIWWLISVQFIQSCPTLWPCESQHARPPCLSPTPGVYSNSGPLSQWCHATISSSVVPFSCPQSFLASGGQSIGVSALTSVLPMNIQDWFPLGWTGWIFLQSKGLSGVFSNTIVQMHQFFGAQLSLQSNSHIHTQLLEKP